MDALLPLPDESPRLIGLDVPDFHVADLLIFSAMMRSHFSPASTKSFGIVVW
jgi:hypothetical protein